MNIKNVEKIEAFSGQEGTKIKQIFSPDVTLNIIRYSIAHWRINPGKTSIPHTMNTSEVYYILEGNGMIHIEDEERKVKKNEVIFVPPNSRQFLENNGETDLIALCIVDPAWKQEDEISE